MLQTIAFYSTFTSRYSASFSVFTLSTMKSPFLLAARHDLDCYLEGVDPDSSCSDSLDFINTHLIREIGDILGIVQ